MWIVPRETRICPTCKKEFVVKTTYKKVFCSLHCANMSKIGKSMRTPWEVDWDHEGNTGSRFWARNPTAYAKSAREWHFVPVDWLRKAGINAPTYRKDSWEIDWGKRVAKKVWARNPYSKMPWAREWHWIQQSAVNRMGIAWKPYKSHTGRCVNDSGYVCLTRMGMTDEEIALAEKFNLFKGERKTFVYEHQLVAIRKYDEPLDGRVVRHLNGVKADNRPENLVLGTQKENQMDHCMARRMAMYWREKCERLEKELSELKRQLATT